MVANVRRGSCLTAEAKILLLMMPLVGWWYGLEYCFFFYFSFLFLILIFLFSFATFFLILQKKFWHCKNVKCKLIMIIIMIIN